MLAHQRIRELDGLRGLALIGVFCFHCFGHAAYLDSSGVVVALRRIASVGWAGVDLFFVLSGYLITSILLRSRGQPHYFRTFYGRRALRIFPLYYVALAVLWLVVIPWADPEAPAVGVWQHLLYVQNWIYALGLPAPSIYLGHFWSLAIEEQFYLVWPFVVALLPPRWTLAAAGLVTAAAVAYRTLGAPGLAVADVQTFFFFGTATRLDCLMIGSGLAVLLSAGGRSRQLPRVALLALSAATIGLVAVWSNKIYTGMPGALIFPLIGLLCASAIAAALTMPAEAWLRRALRWRPLGFVGVYSYGMYVVHWPIILLMGIAFQQQPYRGLLAWLSYVAACALLTTGAALVSWHLLEKHMLRLRRAFG